MSLLYNIGNIYRRISHAAMRAGREPLEVDLVAVSKTVDIALMREAVDDGLRVFGESRVQEAAGKFPEMTVLGARLHMIGRLQKNKVRRAVELFDLIHSVDSIDLLTAIERRSQELQKVQRVLIEVKLSPEHSKSGADERELETILNAAGGLPNVRVEGLMTMPPFDDDPEAARPYFRRLRELAGQFGLGELSMGMSHDFEVAISEGSTLVRVGSAIFGGRQEAQA